jgi:3',5'-cyclic AMP phosphodiesterase CpdA
MFTLAHLSDPHLAPLPWPTPLELLSKRGLGYINWLRKRRSIHRPETLAALVADLKRQAPDHIAVTGDLVNLSLSNEFGSALAWLETLGSPRDVTAIATARPARSSSIAAPRRAKATHRRKIPPTSITAWSSSTSRPASRPRPNRMRRPTRRCSAKA